MSTSTSVVVLVPVLARPERVEIVRDNIAASEHEVPLSAIFIASSRDQAEHAALVKAGVRWIETKGPVPGDYARKINAAVWQTTEPWLFLGADDLRFEPGWADECLRVAAEKGARVIGTNDLGNRAVVSGHHSTHSLVARSYIEEHGTIDQPGRVLHEGYEHQFVDNEFIETARHRGELAMAMGAIVEHLHPHWRKGEMDATYERALVGFTRDQRKFRVRRRLWAGGRRVASRRIRNPAP